MQPTNNTPKGMSPFASASAGGMNPMAEWGDSFSHYAWGGRLCLHPFTEGLAAVLMHGSQAFGRKEPKLGGGSLLVIFPPSPKRVITLLALSQRDRGRDFKFGISLSRDSAMRNPKLNGCSDTLPPHA